MFFIINYFYIFFFITTHCSNLTVVASLEPSIFAPFFTNIDGDFSNILISIANKQPLIYFDKDKQLQTTYSDWFEVKRYLLSLEYLSLLQVNKHCNAILWYDFNDFRDALFAYRHSELVLHSFPLSRLEPQPILDLNSLDTNIIRQNEAITRKNVIKLHQKTYIENIRTIFKYVDASSPFTNRTFRINLITAKTILRKKTRQKDSWRFQRILQSTTNLHPQSQVTKTKYPRATIENQFLKKLPYFIKEDFEAIKSILNEYAECIFVKVIARQKQVAYDNQILEDRLKIFNDIITGLDIEKNHKDELIKNLAAMLTAYNEIIEQIIIHLPKLESNDKDEKAQAETLLNNIFEKPNHETDPLKRFAIQAAILHLFWNQGNPETDGADMSNKMNCRIADISDYNLLKDIVQRLHLSKYKTPYQPFFPCNNSDLQIGEEFTFLLMQQLDHLKPSQDLSTDMQSYQKQNQIISNQLLLSEITRYVLIKKLKEIYIENDSATKKRIVEARFNSTSLADCIKEGLIDKQSVVDCLTEIHRYWEIRGFATTLLTILIKHLELETTPNIKKTYFFPNTCENITTVIEFFTQLTNTFPEIKDLPEAKHVKFFYSEKHQDQLCTIRNTVEILKRDEENELKRRDDISKEINALFPSNQTIIKPVFYTVIISLIIYWIIYYVK